MSDAPNKADILQRLQDACNGNPATIQWPHRLLHDAIDEIKQARAALSAVGETQVQVKPLVWVQGGDDSFMHDADFVDTTQTYQIQEGLFWYAAEVQGVPCGSNEAAKVAAQAHHDATIRAALISAPDTDGVSVQEAAKE